MINPEKKIDLIYDHYKDTVAVTSESIKRRDRLMLYVVVILGLFTFQLASPTTSNQVLTDLLNFKFGLKFGIDFESIRSIIWTFLLIFTARYFQVSAFVERQYVYIHRIENNLNDEFGGDLITREGKSYLNEYPWFSRWLWLFYTIAFPLLVIFLGGYGWVSGFQGLCRVSSSQIYNSLVFICLVISTALYLAVLHLKKDRID